MFRNPLWCQEESMNNIGLYVEGRGGIAGQRLCPLSFGLQWHCTSTKTQLAGGRMPRTRYHFQRG